MSRDKRIVFAADPHCGALYGLAPPHWWSRDDAKYRRISKVGKFQRELWGFYTKAIDSLKPIDILSMPGDCIDGKGEKSGGMELITTDRHEQIIMAKEAIDYAEAKNVRITYGTAYHTGREEDFESLLKSICKGRVSIHGHDFIRVNGINIDIKHKIGKSSIPHGQMTPLARARLWNAIWFSEKERQPKADILVRAHIHHYNFCGQASWLGIICPALTYHSNYGIRSCEGLVDVGLIVIDITAKGNYSWRPILANFPELRVESEVL